jgi:hypothetical protein
MSEKSPKPRLTAIREGLRDGSPAAARGDQFQVSHINRERAPAHLQLPSGLNEAPTGFNFEWQVPKLNSFPEPKQLVCEAMPPPELRSSTKNRTGCRYG